MRQVDRSSVGNPPCLDRDLSAEIEKIREGAKPRTDITILYLHEKYGLCPTLYTHLSTRISDKKRIRLFRHKILFLSLILVDTEPAM